MNIICDLDGTIALDQGRAHHLHGIMCDRRYDHRSKCICQPSDRNWKAYFEACDTDKPCQQIIELLEIMHDRGVNIVILSGRSLSVSEKTVKWLKDHCVKFNWLQMRSEEDRTDDHLLKARWAVELDLNPANTMFVLEDRTRVVEMWRNRGFKCFQVAEGNF